MTGNSTIGDDLEGLKIWSRYELKNTHIVLDGHDINISNGLAGLSYSWNQSIFCMSNINILKNFSTLGRKRRLFKQLINQFYIDYQYPKKIVVILNYHDFMNRLLLGLKIMGYKYGEVAFGMVKYDNDKNNASYSIKDYMYKHFGINRDSAYWINFVKNTKFAPNENLEFL